MASNSTNNTDSPRIYVASLADYNAGRLHGRWIDATYGVEEIHDEIREMLAESPEPIAEDWAIHDSDGFAGLAIHEHEDLVAVAEAAELLDEYGPKAAQVIAHYGGLSELDEARETLEERYAGSAEDLESWGEQFAEDTGALSGVPKNLLYYFDFEKYARDFELSGDIFTVRADGELHVFWTR